jgi:hypothetical protein
LYSTTTTTKKQNKKTKTKELLFTSLTIHVSLTAAISTLLQATTPTPARTSCPDHSHDHTPPGDHWSGTQDFGANNPLLHTLKDTKCTNPKFSGSVCGCIVWSGHCYLDRDSSGTHFNWTAEVEAGVTVQTGAERLQDFVTWLKANNYQHAHIGEMGTGNDNVGWLTSLNNAMTVMDDNAWEFTYWSAGPWFSGG